MACLVHNTEHEFQCNVYNKSIAEVITPMNTSQSKEAILAARRCRVPTVCIAPGSSDCHRIEITNGIQGDMHIYSCLLHAHINIP